MRWTDRFLLAHFSGDLANRKIIERGPYRLVRHPRYLALTDSRIAFALVLASIVLWCLFPLWMFAILHRIQREELHLRKIFGPDYEAYCQGAARLIPGIY